MRKYWYLLIIGLVVLTQTSCSVPAGMSRGEVYSKMYEEDPVSILVMPPINNTSHVDAKDLLYTSISNHVAEAGYYVVSPLIAMDVLRNESAYDAEYFFDAPLGKFKEFFGADAVVFAVIDKWSKVGFEIHTVIRYVIKSTTTNDILFDRTCDLTLNLVQDSGDDSLFGLLTDVLVTAIDAATTQHIEAARRANAYIFDDLPRGKYSPMYQQDKEYEAKEKVVVKYLKK